MAIKFNNIFFPTDFSNNAQRALPLAAEIASRTDSKLIMFHASQSALDFAPDFEQQKKKAINKASQQFDKLITDLKKDDQYKDLEISTVLQSGHPNVGLLAKATEYNADLIVMGTKGATGNRSVTFGSVASSIINKSDIPVLAVPPGGSLDDLKHITFTTDYHEGDFNALKQTIDFAELFKSSIDIIHVAEQRSLLAEIKFRGFRDLVKDQTDYENISFEIKYDYDFFPVMADYFVDNPNSLLVMVRYQKTFWEKMVEKAHSKEMGFYTKVPLLVLIGE
ncbi:universal stress protein [Aliifodinibius sp. S!AR15-10]|uniref:universal stress protein n=1 Tax=Aliifodinibius sp. S!AR15-10 TaxID=2950437 RepID=UPI00285B04C6|nr:universal stress protein [Aliifodinibius sp. S!AR15-10]MDR8394391.1 universal stress protein [Aliifodinibius sp. S!AR15-10]